MRITSIDGAHYWDGIVSTPGLGYGSRTLLLEIGPPVSHAPTQSIPRPEYPRPILRRSRWHNLNGQWQFAQDPQGAGLREGWQHRTTLAQSIVVPFTAESDASGIAQRELADVLWYTREFDCTEPDLAQRLLLHIGACDYASQVFINGQEAGRNRGGYAPFSFDIAHLARVGTNRVTIRCEDGPSWSQPRGKQEGTTRWPIDYDRVSGIWQTVWLEPVPSIAITDLHWQFSYDQRTLSYHVNLNRLFTGQLTVVLHQGDNELTRTQVAIDQRSEIKTVIDLASLGEALPLWSPDAPNLCEVGVLLRDASDGLIDEATSYVGLREIRVHAGQIELNGQPLYLRGVLDQGYFPGGWYSALDDSDYRRDIELTKALGFNGARKHQKAEDPRYLYWADRLGLLVWAEMPSGRIFSSDLVQDLTAEWLRLVRRDRAHPCVMAWVPFNESWGVWHQAQRPQQRAFVDGLAQLTRSLDTSRLIIANDGWEYSSGDLWTLHLYEDATSTSHTDFADRLNHVLANPHASLQMGGQGDNPDGGRVGALPGADVEGLPVLLTECGGVGYRLTDPRAQTDSAAELFAYGDLPSTMAELEQRVRAIAADVHGASPLQGFVWTQLTDIQQEMNGLLSFNREPKLPLTLLHAIFSAIGARHDKNKPLEATITEQRDQL